MLKPDWLKVRLPQGENYERIKGTLRSFGLYTVCEEASCPNIAECWGGGTATLMLMGDRCTRGCRFCNVKSGRPNGWLDALEPEKVGRALHEWGLRYIVLTSVCRDDLPDGGAGHFADTIKAIKHQSPEMIVEALIPDFAGKIESIRKIVSAGAEVIGHNLETTEMLTPKVRDLRATYRQSLEVLETVKAISPSTYTKSSLMLGLGELEAEVTKTMSDLRKVGVDILTLGQYLRPSERHLQVVEYIPPNKFEHYRAVGKQMGFLYVAAGPFVRSSYRAGELFLENVIRSRASQSIAT